MKIKYWHSNHIVEDSEIPRAIVNASRPDYYAGELERQNAKIEHLKDVIMMLLEDCTDRKLADIASRIGFDVVEK